MIEKIKINFRKYLTLQNRVENLSKSRRLEAKEKASELSTRLSDLHSIITMQMLEYLHGEDFDMCNFADARQTVSVLIALYKAGLRIHNSSKEMKSIELEHPSDNRLFASILSGDSYDFRTHFNIAETVRYSGSCGLYDQAEEIEVDISMASDSLKELAMETGLPLVAYITGSYHENFGVVTLDFSKINNNN